MPADWPRELKPLALAFYEMLKRLDDSFTRLSQFAADLAHELRTPIANMLAEAQVVLTRERTPNEYREVIESSIVECERLSGIVDNLLFVARVDAAREPIERTRLDTRAAVEKIATFYQRIVRLPSVAEAKVRFTRTQRCSSARLATWSITHCVSARKTAFKSRLPNTGPISRSQSAIMAVG